MVHIVFKIIFSRWSFVLVPLPSGCPLVCYFFSNQLNKVAVRQGRLVVLVVSEKCVCVATNLPRFQSAPQWHAGIRHSSHIFSNILPQTPRDKLNSTMTGSPCGMNLQYKRVKFQKETRRACFWFGCSLGRCLLSERNHKTAEHALQAARMEVFRKWSKSRNSHGHTWEDGPDMETNWNQIWLLIFIGPVPELFNQALYVWVTL